MKHRINIGSSEGKSGHSCSGICRVVPSYVFEQIALNAPERQRAAALRTLVFDASVRLGRVEGPGFGPGAKPAFGYAGAGGQRFVYDTHNSEVLPGELVRSEDDDASGDVAINEAFDGLGATYDLLLDQYYRDSIDGSGMDLLATVHYGREYDNAFWNGSQMVFGDGDGELFNRFTIALDVIGHELFHGVTQYGPGLVYSNQPGALNESISDVGGSLVKQMARGEKAEDADWLIGEGLFTSNVNGVALRSMAAPGTAYDDPILGRDPQPDHMSDYVRTNADSGGVHVNSGIPNHAFYQVAMALGGYAWEGAGLIWYEALMDPSLGRRTGFLSFAATTLRTARRLFGPGSAEADAVRDGWAYVGIEVGQRARLRPTPAAFFEPGYLVDTAAAPWAAHPGEGGEEDERPRRPSGRTRSRSSKASRASKSSSR
jgi:Thermolysin metallopeptidase, alpha-helical domain/Thermolysin metallopeptidase, catalytic domain